MNDILECVPVELDRRPTILGELVLRRRKIRGLDYATVFEVLLDGEFLMSSAVNQSERALAHLGLAAWGDAPCRVLVGGLGLGYTVQAALESAAPLSVDVLELLDSVLEWHARGLVPLGDALTHEPRVRLLQGDFFAWAAGAESPASARYDVVLVDIDHSSEFLLQSAHASLYSEDGLRALSGRLAPGGVFAYWSSDPGEPELARMLRAVFPRVEVHEVSFPNPAMDRDEVNSIVVAHREQS